MGLNQQRILSLRRRYESKNMQDAHAESVMILGEGFQKNEPLDFASQTMIKRVAEIVPAVLKERLRAPPEEVYSVHRSFSTGRLA